MLLYDTVFAGGHPMYLHDLNVRRLTIGAHNMHTHIYVNSNAVPDACRLTNAYRVPFYVLVHMLCLLQCLLSPHNGSITTNQVPLFLNGASYSHQDQVLRGLHRWRSGGTVFGPPAGQDGGDLQGDQGSCSYHYRTLNKMYFSTVHTSVVATLSNRCPL